MQDQPYWLGHKTVQMQMKSRITRTGLVCWTTCSGVGPPIAWKGWDYRLPYRGWKTRTTQLESENRNCSNGSPNFLDQDETPICPDGAGTWIAWLGWDLGPPSQGQTLDCLVKAGTFGHPDEAGTIDRRTGPKLRTSLNGLGLPGTARIGLGSGTSQSWPRPQTIR